MTTPEWDVWPKIDFRCSSKNLVKGQMDHVIVRARKRENQSLARTSLISSIQPQMMISDIIISLFAVPNILFQIYFTSRHYFLSGSAQRMRATSLYAPPGTTVCTAWSLPSDPHRRPWNTCRGIRWGLEKKTHTRKIWCFVMVYSLWHVAGLLEHFLHFVNET